ncbi:MAG: metallophosphoesterase family protein [Synergistales bacterium]
MKIALISDVHANLPALEAVMEHARARGCEALWNVGDCLGYGAFPEEVVRILRRHALNILGNYDRKVLEVRERKADWQESLIPEKWMAFNWAFENLSEESRQWLRDLPERRRMEVDGKRVLLVHASPLSASEHLFAATPKGRFETLADAAAADVVVCGHSHSPFVLPVKGTWFVNPGSVGRPDDGDARAGYATLSLGRRIFRVCHYRVPYDVQRAAEEARRRKLPESFAQMLLRGLSLKEVLDGNDRVPGSEESSGGGGENPLESVMRLVRLCGDEAEHSIQVERLALRLFDLLQPLHGLGEFERFWLQCASLLHDIGWVEGGTGHHKASMRLIQVSPLLPFDPRERRIIGSIARYHRGSLPKDFHANFRALSDPDRVVVRKLASLLRLADGMDASHHAVVKAIGACLKPGRVLLECGIASPAFCERSATEKKKNLFELTFERELRIKWTQA